MREVNHLSISCKKSTEMSEVVANETDASIFFIHSASRNSLNRVPKKVKALYSLTMNSVWISIRKRNKYNNFIVGRTGNHPRSLQPTRTDSEQVP